MTAPFLSIQGLAEDYGAVVAVQDVSLDIAEGEFLTFLGPSGSGKSTTLYIIAGFQRTDGGRHLLNGKYPARRAVEQAQYRHGVPALHAVPATDAWPRSCLSAAGAPPAEGGDRRQGRQRC